MPTPDFIRTIDSASEDEGGKRQPKPQPKPKPSKDDRPASKKEQVRRRRDRVLVPQQPIQSLAQAALGSVGSFGKGAKEEEDEGGFDPGFSFGDGLGNGLGMGDGEAEPAVVLSAVDQILERRWGAKRAGAGQARGKEIMVDAEQDDGMSVEEEAGEEGEEDEGEEEEEEEEDWNLMVGSGEEGEGMEDDGVDYGEDSEEEQERQEEEGEGERSEEEEEEEEEEGSEEESAVEKAKKAAFFSSDSQTVLPSTGSSTTFESLGLSRPILRALSLLSFHRPTPIQRAVLPVAMAGKDVVGQAVTGSGKTAAFILPILERMLYRPKGAAQSETRVLVLCPTRELAQQCYEVAASLARFVDLKACLCVGGLSLKGQELQLRARPDIVIATPGRLIDHVRNSKSFTLDALDILVMDEADRMLEDGFKDELDEIVGHCPVARQTMLFSATMTDRVDELVRLSLNQPVRLFVDPKKSTAKGLVQEFVRVKGKSAAQTDERTAILVALCQQTFRSGVIVFLRSKLLAHRMKIIFGLLGLNAGELHGDLTQEQRMHALASFKAGSISYLLATDLASRGLDVKGVETVINFDLPAQIESYLHRVGRTARAGRQGRSVSLVGESDRKMLKSIIKRSAAHDPGTIRHRVIKPEELTLILKEIQDLKEDIESVLVEEKEAKQIRQAEMELKKSENMVLHADEIAARPARTWFQTEADKTKSKNIGKESYLQSFGKDEQVNKKDASGKRINGLSGLSRKARRRKIALEDDDLRTASNSAIRKAKKAALPQKISSIKTSRPAPIQKKKKKARSSFDDAPAEGARSKPGVGGLKSHKKPRHKARK